MEYLWPASVLLKNFGVHAESMTATPLRASERQSRPVWAWEGSAALLLDEVSVGPPSVIRSGREDSTQYHLDSFSFVAHGIYWILSCGPQALPAYSNKGDYEREQTPQEK